MAGMLPDLQAAAGAARVVAYTDLRRFIEILSVEACADGFPATAVGGHADVAETSMVLANRPALVHMDRAQAGLAEDFETTLRVIFDKGLKAMSPIGVLGDPQGASAELGERILAALVNEIVTTFNASWR
jgi:creatinine amidohydrolase